MEWRRSRKLVFLNGARQRAPRYGRFILALFWGFTCLERAEKLACGGINNNSEGTPVLLSGCFALVLANVRPKLNNRNVLEKQ